MTRTRRPLSATAMHHAQLTEAVRRQVAETLAQFGMACADELRESILIRDGAYCGRRFEGAEGHAVWFVEENQLKFYRADGSVARILEPAVSQPIATRIAA